MRTFLAAATLLSIASVQPPGVPAQVDEYQRVLDASYASNEPGAAAIVAVGDEIVFVGSAGMADIELGVPLAADMVFEIGSMTKQLTAAAIMMLEEEGKLSVSDSITAHLSDYPSSGNDITIEHLLTHTSGIFNISAVEGYSRENQTQATVDDLVGIIAELPLEFPAGERFKYSNSGYLLLGAIIEAASGTTYQEFLRTHVFEPLGMSRAYYGCRACVIPGRVSGYAQRQRRWLNARYVSLTRPYAAGALMMTVEDWYRWSRALFGGDVVNPGSLERMITPSTPSEASRNYGYGLVIGSMLDRRVIRHGGAISGFTSTGLYFPEEEIIVAVFQNRIPPGDLNEVAERLAAIALGEHFPGVTASEFAARAARANVVAEAARSR